MTSTTRRSVLGLFGAGSLAAAGVLTGSNVAAHADRAPSGPIPVDLLPGGAFDRFVAERAARDEFSGTVLLAHRGRPVLARSHGMANKKESIPNRLDTIFGLASGGKLFPAVAITQLVRQGKVALHATLGTYLDGFRTDVADTVTIHQLLISTSGLDDFQRTPEYQENKDDWTTPEEKLEGILAIIRKMPLLATPGTRFNVKSSNSGQLVLEAIVQRVSGQSYQDYAREHVLVPGGIDRTEPPAEGDVAHRYGNPGPDGQRVDLTEQGKGDESGADGASAPELLGFARALLGGDKLLTPAYAELLTSGKNPVAPDDRHLSQPKTGDLLTAYGMDVGIVNKQRVLRRTGESIQPGGITAGLCVYPDLDWVAVILGNYYFDIVPYLELLDRLVAQQ